MWAAPPRGGREWWACAVVAAGLAAGCARRDAAWEAELGSADPFARAVAALALSAQAPREAGKTVEVLLETVDRSELGLEEEARVALARGAPWCAEELVRALAGGGFLTAERRAAVLGALSASGRAGAETIVAALRGGGAATRGEVMGELGVVLVRIGRPAVEPLALLLSEGREARLSGYAAFVLGQLGGAARDALPALRAARGIEDADVRAAVEQAIRSIEAGGAPATGGAGG